MKLYKIKNSYMYKSNNPNGDHTYAVYYDRKRKRHLAVQTTHLYKKDGKKADLVNAGALIERKLPVFALPSGVKNYAYTTDVHGNKINLRSKDVTLLSKYHLPKKTADAIKSHAKGRFTMHKK